MQDFDITSFSLTQEHSYFELPLPASVNEIERQQKDNAERGKLYASIAVKTVPPKPRTWGELGLERLARMNEKQVRTYATALQRDRDFRSHISRPLKLKPILIKGYASKPRAARARRSSAARVRPASASSSAPSGGSSSGSDGPPPRRTYRRYDVASNASALSQYGRAA